MEHQAWTFIAICCLALLIPHASALGTLLGMGEKTFIPLLRTRDANGQSHAFMRMIQMSLHPPIHRRVLWSLSVMS